MANYTKSTNFAVKDGLPSGDPLKVVKGTEIDTEFNNIATAVTSKADISGPTFLGTPFAPTASAGTNTNQIATTAFVTTAVAATQSAAAITGGSITGITDLAIADGGTGASTAANARTNLGTNDAANITTGTLGTARLGSGTASSSTYLRGDQTWQTVEMLGVSQTWQDVTASRTSGTTYTNSTGKPIMVNILVSNGVYTTTTLTVGGVVVGRCSNPTTSSGAQATLSAIVPNGVTYSSSGYIEYWTELR